MHVWTSIHEYPVSHKDGELPTDRAPFERPITLMSYMSFIQLALLEDADPMIRLIALGVRSICMMTQSNSIRLRDDFFPQDGRHFSETTVHCLHLLPSPL